MGKIGKAKKIKRKRKHGFRYRLKTRGGQNILRRRRGKKRKRLAL